MEEIKVSEYVRTTNQGIKKIDGINENAPINRYKYKTGESDWDGEWYGTIKTTEIVKHSFNLIDLIEVGDIIEIQTGLYNRYKIIIEDEDKLISAKENLKTWTLKSIVTHEQMKSIEYEV